MTLPLSLSLSPSLPLSLPPSFPPSFPLLPPSLSLTPSPASSLCPPSLAATRAQGAGVAPELADRGGRRRAPGRLQRHGDGAWLRGVCAVCRVWGHPPRFGAAEPLGGALTASSS